MAGKTENLLAQANAANAEASSVNGAARFFPTEAEAVEVFQKLKRRLFAVEKWNAESEITRFGLFDADGSAQPEKNAAVGDYIKTVLPGSGKDDWVKIIEIFDAPNEIVLTVQPSPNPTGDAQASATSHFFIADSTNNFCLQLIGAKIKFSVIGINERTNIKDTNGIVESVRNLATANIGSYFGIQNTQWQTFCDNFIGSEKEF